MTLEKDMFTGRSHAKWMGTKTVDALGEEIKVGDKVARAITSGRAVNLEFTEVREIKDGRVYLAGSKVPINFPSRLLVINKLFPTGE